jgi:hypothetical protein
MYRGRAGGERILRPVSLPKWYKQYETHHGGLCVRMPTRSASLISLEVSGDPRAIRDPISCSSLGPSSSDDILLKALARSAFGSVLSESISWAARRNRERPLLSNLEPGKVVWTALSNRSSLETTSMTSARAVDFSLRNCGSDNAILETADLSLHPFDTRSRASRASRNRSTSFESNTFLYPHKEPFYR